MNWRRYQEETAEFFRGIGCEADVEAKVQGARAEHKIDVWVRFNKFGLETKWVVECKCWNSNVTKEKVLVLRSIVEDVGADRGILISMSGYQSGAVQAAKKANVTLTDLDGLRENAQEEILAAMLHCIETKLVEIKYSLRNLFDSDRTGPCSWMSRPITGIDGSIVMSTIGKLAFLEHGFDLVRLRQPPYPITFDEAGQRPVLVNTLDKFITQASEVISDAEATLASQLASKSK